MSAVSEVLVDLSAALEEAGCAWYVFGAQAVVAHGVPRATQDLDVTVLLEPAQAPALAEMLARHGFALRVDDDLAEWVARTFVIPVWHRAREFPVDVVLALSELERSFAARSDTHLLGPGVPVISASDLVVAKLLAGRTQDLADVQGLLGSAARIDHDHVLALLQAIETGLDLPGLVDLYRSCLP